jgi:DNA invertase Pin-like site-specific DNA recombinase
MSIANQRQMLLDYVKEKGWNLRDIYFDDGFSGTNFERPAFKRMIQDVESGKINCIITKDLSRFGRNYVKTGYYTEEYFVEMGVRFIAVNDSIDTIQENNDIAPFQNILNEWYPKDISKKVRQVKKSSAQQGKFMGSQAPYGYKKSEADKHVLVVDEPAAVIIRRIFGEFAAGDSARMIANRLNQEKVDSPRFYHAQYSGGQRPKSTENNNWGSCTIIQLLHNQAYIGNMVQGKRQVVSFKTKKRREVDPENWIIVEHTHDPIVDDETWDRTQKRLTCNGHHIKRLKETGKPNLFSGLLRCGDCGARMAYIPKHLKTGIIGTYRCESYANNGKTACSPHYIQEETLKGFVLNDIRLHAQLANADREQITQRLITAIHHTQAGESRLLSNKLREMQNRVEVINSDIKNLYEDKCMGKLPESVFQNLLRDFTREQDDLIGQIQNMQGQLDVMQSTENGISNWLDLISGYMEITDLDRATATELIESIEIGESGKEHHRMQEISIHYRFIGNLLGHSVADPEDAKEDIA